MKFNEAIQQHEEALGIEVRDGTIRGYGYDLRQIALFLRNPHIEQVQVRDLIQMFRLMIVLDWKQNSFTPKVCALRKFFKYWRRQGAGVLDPEAIPKPRREFNPPRVANQENLTKLIEHVKKQSGQPMARSRDEAGRWRHVRNLAVILLLRDTGCRIGELLSFNVDQVDVEHPRETNNPIFNGEKVWGIVIHTEKSRGIRPFRQVFWKEEANVALKEWIETRPELLKRWKNDFMNPEALFFGTSRYQHGKRLEPSSASLFLRNYCVELGIPTINAHSLRHLFCHDIVKHRYGTSTDVMNLAGHASLTSSSPYTSMFGKELEERYRLLRGNGQPEKQIAHVQPAGQNGHPGYPIPNDDWLQRYFQNRDEENMIREKERILQNNGQLDPGAGPHPNPYSGEELNPYGTLRRNGKPPFKFK